MSFLQESLCKQTLGKHNSFMHTGEREESKLMLHARQGLRARRACTQIHIKLCG